jgi:hypothetical protein
MKIQYNQVVGQPSSPRDWCDYCCFPKCIPINLHKCVVKSFKRTNTDIFKL